MMDTPQDHENRREIFRVSLAAAKVRVRIDRRLVGHILDAHSEGFGATMPDEERFLQVGRVVEVRLEYDGTNSSGRARVRSVIRRADGGCRCGFAIPPAEHDLRRHLRQIAITVQRKRLRRAADRR